MGPFLVLLRSNFYIGGGKICNGIVSGNSEAQQNAILRHHVAISPDDCNFVNLDASAMRKLLKLVIRPGGCLIKAPIRILPDKNLTVHPYSFHYASNDTRNR